MGRKKQILHIYTRVSTTSQVERGFSLQNQRDKGIELSKKLKMDYKIWNEGGKSSFGELLDREVLCDLLDGMKNGEVKNLFVYDIDRLSRNKDSWYLILRDLEKYEVSVYTSNGQTYDLGNESDELIMGMFSLVSQWDNKQRLRRFKQGKINKFLDGYYVHGTRVYGFDRVSKGKGKILVENKEQGKVVRKIFQMFSKGKSVKNIQDYLLQNKIKTSRGKDVWSSKQILDMLRRETFVGKISWTDSSTKKTYNGTCNKIVDDKLWYDVQSRLVDIENISRSQSRQKHDYLLTGFLYCGVCGYLMRGLTDEKTYRHLYYCGSKMERYRKSSLLNKCDRKKSKSVNVKRMDDLVWTTLLDTIDNSNILKEQVKQQVLEGGKNDRELGIKKLVNEKNKQIKKEQINLNKQEKKELQIYSWWVDDTIDDEQQSVMMKEVHKKKLDIQTNIKRLEMDKGRLLQNNRWIDWISSHSQNIDKLKSISDIDKKKEVLQGYVKRVEVEYDTLNRVHEVDMEIRLRLFNDKYVVVGKTKDGKKYDILEGENRKTLKLDKTKVGRKKGTQNQKKKR